MDGVGRAAGSVRFVKDPIPIVNILTSIIQVIAGAGRMSKAVVFVECLEKVEQQLKRAGLRPALSVFLPYFLVNFCIKTLLNPVSAKLLLS